MTGMNVYSLTKSSIIDVIPLSLSQTMIPGLPVLTVTVRVEEPVKVGNFASAGKMVVLAGSP
jgi:hypothetical protein